MISVAGVVLCGGASRRMGRPKAELSFGTDSLLSRAVRLLDGLVRPVVVAAAAGQALPTWPTDVIVSYDVAPYEGPAAGLLTAARLLPTITTHAMVVGCDAPLLTSAILDRVLKAAVPGRGVAVVTGGVRQPLPAVYPMRVLTAAGRDFVRSLQQLLDQANVVELDAESFRDLDPSLAAFASVNTVFEYHEALRRAGFGRANEEVQSPDG